MPIETIEFKGSVYPRFQKLGNAAEFCMPFAKKVLSGDIIYDIGYGKEEWKFPGAIGVDVKDESEYNAMNLPPLMADGIFASHVLEHIPNFVSTLEYWHSKIKYKGVLFLYLPNMISQKYHRNWHNKKHVSFMSPEIMRLYFEDNATMWQNVFISERDAYDAFTVIAEKK